MIELTSGDGQTFSAYRADPIDAPKGAVVIVQEIFGVNPHIRKVADGFAAQGYIAIAPDLLSGMAPNGGGSAELGDGVRKAIGSLPDDQITGDLNAIANYVAKLPACNGKVVVVGFCWGGGQAFRYATNNPDLKAAFVCYGPPIKQDEVTRINCPVYGFYGGNDARITTTVPGMVDAMKKAGKTYEPVIYEGAGHGFMRAGEAPDPGCSFALDYSNDYRRSRHRR